VNAFEADKEGVFARKLTAPKQEERPARDTLKEMGVERVRLRLVRWIAAPEIVGIPVRDERPAEAALGWDELPLVAQMTFAHAREGAR